MRPAGDVTQRGFAAAVAQGVAARDQWFISGDVIPARALAERWSLTARQLGAAVNRGELLALVRSRRRYHPSEFLELEPQVVFDICRDLSKLPPETQLIFWKRRHGALGGRTVLEFLGRTGCGEEQVRSVVGLANAWAAESVDQ